MLIDDMAAHGKALREQTPTSAHDHAAAGGRRLDAVEFVERSNAGRLPELTPLRIGRMTASPFTFFRGAAGLMAADLAGTPHSGIAAQLCGDAHAGNFGLYGTAHGDIVMDVNDMDETIPGPWEWDLKRLAASLVLAGREGDVAAAACREAAEDAVKSYRRTVRDLSQLGFLEAWAALPDESAIEQARADALLDDFERAASKARRNTSAKVVAKWARRLEDHETGIRRHRFVDDPPVLTHVDPGTADAVRAAMPRYCATLPHPLRPLMARFAVSDVAFRIVGTGSVGLRSYLALLQGNGDEVLVLQFKQARPSALLPYLPAAPTDQPAHEGERIVRGTHFLQTASDMLLGWTTIAGEPFLVRQFRNFKGAIEPTELAADHLDDYGRLAGALLARAHARSLDVRVLAAYLDEDDRLDEAIGAYAVRYADQTEADHAALVAAVRSGRLPAESVSPQ